MDHLVADVHHLVKCSANTCGMRLTSSLAGGGGGELSRYGKEKKIIAKSE
jgi:hypothetical protein